MDGEVGVWWWLACQREVEPKPPAETSAPTVPGSTSAPGPTDADGDGARAEADCDDEDPARFPGAPERCDGIDNDCDGLAEEDADGDGWFACEECDDLDETRYPDALDLPDGIDQGCDGTDGVATEAELLLFGLDRSATGMGLAYAAGKLLVGAPGQLTIPVGFPPTVTVLDASGVLDVTLSESAFGFEILPLPGEPVRVAISQPLQFRIEIRELTTAGLAEPDAAVQSPTGAFLGMGMAAMGTQWLAVQAEGTMLFFPQDALVDEVTEHEATYALYTDLVDISVFPQSMASVGDRDGDGLQELGTMGSPGGDEVYVVTPELDTVQSEAPEIWTLPMVAAPSRGLSPGDLDGDGGPDLAGTSPYAPAAYVVPYLGPGQRLMEEHALATIAPEPEAGTGRAALVTDLDGDGQDDLVLGANAGGVVYAFAGPVLGELGREDAAMVWKGEPEHHDPWFGYRLAAGDLDGDGGIDLFMGAPGGLVDTSGGGAVYAAFSPLW